MPVCRCSHVWESICASEGELGGRPHLRLCIPVAFARCEEFKRKKEKQSASFLLNFSECWLDYSIGKGKTQGEGKRERGKKRSPSLRAATMIAARLAVNIESHGREARGLSGLCKGKGGGSIAADVCLARSVFLLQRARSTTDTHNQLEL